VFVVPLHSSSKLGKTIEVVKVAFDSNGLKPGISGSNPVELNCTVPESPSARALVDKHEALRAQSMSTPIATITKQIYGLEIYGSDPFADAESGFDVDGDERCVILKTAGTKVGKCGCRVSQCVPGSLIADAMRFVSGADFAVVNGGGIRGGLPEAISQSHIRQLVPFLDVAKRIDNILGFTVIEMLQNAVAMLGDPKVTTNPDGRYLQVSKGLRFEWYFEGSKPMIGTVEICRNSGDVANQTECTADSEYEILDEDSTYSVVVPGFIADGGDSYAMLVNGYAEQVHYPLHQTVYEVVLDYFSSAYFENEAFDGVPLIDLTAEHSLPPQTQNCKGVGGGSQRVCQIEDVVQVPIGIFCSDEGQTKLQECDQAYHMAEVINNKHDGFMDDLLPHARLVLRETHGIVPCSSGAARGAHNIMVEDASKMGLEHMFVATIGPGCSGDVQDVTGKEWRDESIKNRNNLVISGSSTASTLSDNILYPNLARMSTPEKGIGEGFAYMCKKYSWKRVAIIHDSSTWGTDSAKKFESAMLADETVESELIYMEFGEHTLDRSKCTDYDLPNDPAGRRRIVDAKEGCDPVTSFSTIKVREGYPSGTKEDECNVTRDDHFCMETVLKHLTEKNVKIVFVAAQRDIQRALYRTLYQNRDEPTQDMYGENYAWMSSLVDAALFQTDDGTFDLESFKGGKSSHLNSPPSQPPYDHNLSHQHTQPNLFVPPHSLRADTAQCLLDQLASCRHGRVGSARSQRQIIGNLQNVHRSLG
jgi:hypothetical protein